MDFKSILQMATNPIGIAILGGYLGYKYGNKVSIKNKYVGAGAGAAGAYMLTRTVRSVLGVTAPQQAAQVAAQSAARAAAEQQQLQDYVNMDLDDIGAVAAPPRLPAARAPVLTTSPANGHFAEGSLGKSSYNVEATEESAQEAENILEMKQRN